MRFKWLDIVLIVAFGIVFTSCKDEKKVIKQTEVTFKKEGELTIFKSDSTQIILDIEIADTDFDIQTGLMYRNYPQLHKLNNFHNFALAKNLPKAE